MTDLSAYSDAELLAIAGGGNSTDLSSYSNDELMQIAGIQPQQTVREKIEADAPWYGQAASGILSGFSGLADLAQTVGSYLPGGGGLRAQMDAKATLESQIGKEAAQEAMGYTNIGDMLRGGFDAATGVERATEIGKGGLAHKIGEYLPGTMLGGGKIIDGVGGTISNLAKLLGANTYFGTAGYAGQQLGGDKGELAANVLSLTPLLAAQKTAPLLSDAGRKMELSAFGAGKSRVNQALNRMPDVLDEAGDFQNPISEAIASFRGANKTADSMEGAVLMKELEAQTDGLINELHSKLAKAEAKQTEAIIPNFDKTYEYVNGLAGVSKKEGQKILDEAVEATLNNTDGMISSLQSEKVKLGQAIKDGAWGNDANAALKTNIYKRIRSDLRSTIEDTYGKLTGESPEVIKSLNKDLGQREGLYPLFKDIISAGEARNPLGWLMQNWRSSGGFGIPAVMAAGTLGGVPATAIPIAGALATTPGGRLKIADSLRNVGKASGALIAKGVGGALSGSADQIQSSLQNIGADKQQGENPLRTQLEPQKIKKSATSFNSTLDQALTQAEKKISMQAPKITSIKRVNSTDTTEDFLTKEEGGQQLKAYPPPAKGSGVTVARGVDLGQHSEKDLEDMGVSPKVITKVRKYLGAKDATARKLLKEKPLTLTKAEADELDEAVKNDIFGTVESKLEDKGVTLSKLPEEAQAVIKSISYNFGKNFDQSLPTIWKAIVNKDWAKVQDLLVTTKWKQPELLARRKREAELLSRIE